MGDSDEKPKYRWPWLVLLVFILGVLLAVIWMLAEIRRTRQLRDFNAPLPAATGANSVTNQSHP